MQTLAELNRRFALDGQVSFEEREPGMLRLRLVADASEAVIYLQGAHVTHWTPRGAAPALFVSPKAMFAPGKAIRGGIPVLFPWFGPRWNGDVFDAAHGTKSPAHGFARTAVWAVDAVDREGDDLVARLSLAPDASSRALGYDNFSLRLECRVGRGLHVALHVHNGGTAPMEFEEGLHAYFAVGDVRAVRLEGLGGSAYLDKRDGGVRKVQAEPRFAFTRDVDRVYLDTEAAVAIDDPAAGRVLMLRKHGSRTTVVWNPWSVLSPGFADLAADDWERFVCVETVNADANRVRLAAGASYAMGMTLSVASKS